MGPEHALPHSADFESSEDYINSLLDFIESSDLLRTLCGGVHILDFFTSNPDLYTQVLPQEWRDFFRQHAIMDVIDLLIRKDLNDFSDEKDTDQWCNGSLPPTSSLEYIRMVRKHLLLREPATSQCNRNRTSKKLARHVAVGMNIKKIHEVSAFAKYINDLTTKLSDSTGTSITHLVDFGSGQNYLGRALASQPYNKHIVAIESRPHNIEGAKDYDVMAKLATKEKIMRNKKAFRAGEEGANTPKHLVPCEVGMPTPPTEPEEETQDGGALRSGDSKPSTAVQLSVEGVGSIQYVEHRIQDGHLSDVMEQIVDRDALPNVSDEGACRKQGVDAFMEDRVPIEPQSKPTKPSAMIISLHSCGNLVHHGLRSLLLNPSVSAVAMVGCCYNLVTERLSPATYKLPELRPAAHPRLEREGTAGDPHGFPMSDRLCKYAGEGVRLNITARMMAVQAPQNWGAKDSEGFFTRHFFRALLQRIFLDRGVVDQPRADCVDGSPLGHTSGAPIIIGSLRKSCYSSFVSYVRGALAKLLEDPDRGSFFEEKMATLTDAEIEDYERRYRERKKELSVIWSLMAFSAGVVEAVIVVDRWLWLKEQEEVLEAWVEPVFDYSQSPRNLVLVGVKK